jgi:pimeloyl-ACP methyl ester carboxylesterase
MLNIFLIKRLSQFLGLLICLVICAVAGLGIYGSLSKADIGDIFPMPGKLVDVGNHKLHINCSGQGEQTVIFESGGGSWSHDWRFVTDDLPETSRVCTYDRAGFGWSENTAGARDFATIVNELHLLLSNADIEGPYILVGASMGGAIAQLYAQKYPSLVSAILLLDARGKRSVTDLLAIEPLLLPPTLVPKIASVLASFNIVHGILKVVGSDRVLLSAHPDLDSYENTVKSIYLDTNVLDKNLRATFIEAMSDAESEEQMDSIEGFGNTPMIVVTHGFENRFSALDITDNQRETIETEWLRQQNAIVQLSSRSKLVVAQESGHLMQLDQPSLVIELVKELLEIIESD